jgi:ubiquitin C-terminal hydrolase
LKSSLEESLEVYFAAKKVKKYECSRCDCDKGQLRVKCLNFSEYVIINVERFVLPKDGVGAPEISWEACEYPMLLDLGKYENPVHEDDLEELEDGDDSFELPPRLYRLVAFIYHDKEEDTGKYAAMVRKIVENVPEEKEEADDSESDKEEEEEEPERPPTKAEWYDFANGECKAVPEESVRAKTTCSQVFFYEKVRDSEQME